MKYVSTRNAGLCVDSAQAILQGLSAEGGLFVPESFPALTIEQIVRMAGESYAARAENILSLYLTDFSREQLSGCVQEAYRAAKFGVEMEGKVAPLTRLNNTDWMLELWHGPTCAFKDMALQLLPHLLTTSSKIRGNEKEIVILVATSGDTGKAALEGFRDVPGTRIIVFYPEDGVSPMQKRQMTTQQGTNVHVCAIRGNFDDAQTAVKTIFTDRELAARLEESGRVFSSANSINWGRLVPQIVYYVSAYADLVKAGGVEAGEPVDICVPTGNFGNILAAFYAKQMGLPVGRLVCASNRNKVLTDFIRTGVYDRNREFFPTSSPSMDILISSNLERLLFELSGRDDGAVASWYRDLNDSGRFEVSDSTRTRLQREFWGGFCDDAATKETIRDTMDRSGCLIDTHTAVAVRVLAEYRAETGSTRPAIVASTANPYKFAASVLEAVSTQHGGDEYEQIAELFRISGMEVPPQLAALRDAQVRFTGSIERNAIRGEVEQVLAL